MTVVEHVEVELKFEAGAAAALPDFTATEGVELAAEPESAQLEATYFDTADLVLARNRVTLRRRTGGKDAGWHLKQPAAAGARRELQAPLTDTAPAALLDPVRALVRDAPLVPVARIGNQRTTWQVRGAQGTAEVCDDLVTAANLLTGGESSWREWEAELTGGDPGVLAVLADALTHAGAEPSSSASKLARALGPLPEPHDKHTVVGGTGGMLQLALAEHRDLVLAQDPLVRADAHDSVHQMRVATRRIRSTLKAYSELFDRKKAKALDVELKWLAAVLGQARDAEVMAERLAGLVDAQPEGSVPASLRERLVGTQLRRYTQAHAEALEAMNGTRYFRLLDALDAAVAAPPFTGDADAPIAKAVRTAVHRVYGQLADTEKAARKVPGRLREHDELLHEVRKHAKQLRYTTELALGAPGCPKQVRVAATAVAKAAKALQERLGDHQDGCITADLLRASRLETDTKAERKALRALLRAEESLATAARKGYRPDAKAVRAAVKALG